MAKDGAPALAAHGLVKVFKDLKAVDGLSLKVSRGTCLALLGPNGAGKTTTVEMLEGLILPDAGTVEVLGLPLARHRRELMARVGVLLQDTSLYKRFTVEETLRLFASFFPRALAVEDVMTRLQLTEKRKTHVRHLSGGQKQRLYLGCALINDPELLFLDEPTTGLDPQAKHAIWDLIGTLKREGKSILLTTHAMDEAEALADHVVIMDHGKIIAEGTPRELIVATCGERVERQETRPATLEDVFLHLTGRSMRDA